MVSWGGGDERLEGQDGQYMGSVQGVERTEHRGWCTRVWHREAQSVLPLPLEVVRIPEPTEERLVLFLDGSGVEGQPPMAGAAAVRVKGVGQVTESLVQKMVYGAASHGEVQAVAEGVGKIGDEVREVWIVMDAEANMASLRRLASRPLHEALGTGLASQA